jgi:hypothetical protein
VDRACLTQPIGESTANDCTQASVQRRLTQYHIHRTERFCALCGDDACYLCAYSTRAITVLEPAKRDSAWRDTLPRWQEDALSEFGDFLARHPRGTARRTWTRLADLFSRYSEIARGPLDTRQQFEILAHRLGTEEDLEALVLTVADAGRTMRWPTVIRSRSESSGLRFLISRNTSALWRPSRSLRNIARDLGESRIRACFARPRLV